MDTLMQQVWSAMPAKELAVVLAMETVAEMSRGLFLPSQATYANLIDPSAHNLVGIGVSVFSAGRLLSGVAFGAWSNRAPFRTVFMTALAIGIVGSVFYGIAGPAHSVALFVLGRLLAGAATGTLAGARAALSGMSSPEERTGLMSWLEACRFVGYALSPGLGIALSAVAPDTRVDGWTVFSSGTMLLLLFQVCISVAIWRILGPEFAKGGHRPLMDASHSVQMSNVGKEGNFVGEENGNEEVEEDEEPAVVSCWTLDGMRVRMEQSLDWIRSPTGTGVCLMIAVNFVCRGILAMLEATGAALYMVTVPDGDHDPTSDASEFFLALGAVGLLMYIAVPPLSRRLPNVILLCIGLCLNAAGCLTLIPYTAQPVTVAALFIGATLVWSLGQPITSALTVSTFSSLLGSKPQGVWMGVIGAAGSIGRIVFPLAVPPPSPNQPSSTALGRTRSTLAIATTILFLAVISLVYFAQKASKQVTRSAPLLPVAAGN